MPKISPRPAPLRTWLIALVLLALGAAILAVYAARSPDGFDSLLDLLAT
jgi:hypothetical protein